jgi:hypothetical protein
MSPDHSVHEVKERLALMVSHRLWGGAYRVRCEVHIPFAHESCAPLRE